MAGRLKASDLPQPWFSSKKGNATTGRQKKTVTTSTVVEDSDTENGPQERGKRGRRRSKVETKGFDAAKRKKKGKPLSSSTLDSFLGIPENAVPDVEELRRKREEDAVACGRTVKTICTLPIRQSGCAAAVTDSSQEERENDAGTAFPCTVGPSSPIAYPNVAWTEADKEVKEDAIGFTENAIHDPTPSFSQRPGKEPIEYDVQGAVDTPQSMPNKVGSKQMQVQIESDTDSAKKYGSAGLRKESCTWSPVGNYSSNNYRGREVALIDSLQHGRRSHRRRFSRSRSRSPTKHWVSDSRIPGSRRSRRSHSRSPVHRSDSQRYRSGQKFRDYCEENAVAERYCHEEEYENSMRYSRREFRHPRGYESPSPGNGYRSRRFQSPEPGGRIGRSSPSPGSGYRSRRFQSPEAGGRIGRSSPSPGNGYQSRRFQSPEAGGRIGRSCTPMSSRSPPRRSRNENDVDGREWRGSTAVEEGVIVETSPALDRTQRRRRQASRESEKAKRERVGKKAFYLTLDEEGKPYGSRKPAWIAEISKLATGLDPSCMHVRKQTFEDVQTFKDRLNDTFEYSGRLNEDYLRGMMGKAVTKKRRELISLIKNNGMQPNHIDHEVWCRQQKLAASKQREEKSEQGRHASACRRTIGRTGAIGESGVRQNLRSMLGRSPDPDEVEYKMQRDKGYGGRKRRVWTVPVKEEKNSIQVIMSDEEMQSPTRGALGSVGLVHERSTEMKKRQRIAKGGHDGVQEVDVGARRIGKAHRSSTMPETKNLSKDEYILQLESQIKRLQAYEGKALTSNTPMPSQSSKSTGEGN